VLTLVTALMAVAGCTHGNNHPAATSTTTSAAPAPWTDRAATSARMLVASEAPTTNLRLPRILDKGRADLAGKLGEYRFGGGVV